MISPKSRAANSPITSFMNSISNRFLVATFAFIPLLVHASENPESLIKRGKLIFEDRFERTSSDGIGSDWTLNNKNGAQQAKIKDGILVIEKDPDAGHSTVVRHDAPFDDGVVKLRFRLFDKTGLKFNLNDPKANKITWAGHVARVVLQPGKVTISDDMTGVYELGVRAKRKNKNLSPDERDAITKFIASKQPTFDAPIKLRQWHEMTLVNQGATFDVHIDGTQVASFTSEGLDHAVKQNHSLGVSGKAEVDDLRIWSLD